MLALGQHGLVEEHEREVFELLDDGEVSSAQFFARIERDEPLDEGMPSVDLEDRLGLGYRLVRESLHESSVSRCGLVLVHDDAGGAFIEALGQPHVFNAVSEQAL